MTLSIVVIEYHSLDEISSFIRNAIPVLSDIDYEIIISSNSLYPPQQQQSIIERYPGIKWLFNDCNGGFAYGMNRGLEVANGEFLMITNPDLILKRGLVNGISFLSKHIDIGAIGPLIKDENGVIQDSARPFVTLNNWLVRQVKRVIGLKEKYDYNNPHLVDWVIGACILFKRDVYRNIGGLDEAYFMYAEDMDFCSRIWLSKKGVAFYPEMEVQYKGTRSARNSWKYAKIFLKSHWHYWKKFGFFKSKIKKNNI